MTDLKVADNFPFAKRGVPTLLLMGGLAGSPDLLNGGRAAGDAWFIGAQLANSRRWPSWSADSEFRAIRAQSGGARSIAPAVDR